MTLDRIEALLGEATPGPLTFEALSGGGWAIIGDTEAIVASRNLMPAALAVIRAAEFQPTRDGEPLDFPNLPDGAPNGPDLLIAIAAYMDRQDDAAEERDGEPKNREVQADVRRWADTLRDTLAAFYAVAEENLP